MGWNPCGMAVTYLRAGYVADVRPFKDSDRTVSIRWFRCKPGAKWLPFSSVIRPQVWNSEDYEFQGRGEVYGTARDFRQYHWVPGLEGTHYCGTRADFEEGGYVADPPVPITPDGVMQCCAGPPGGLVLGGPVTVPPGLVVGGDLGGLPGGGLFLSGGVAQADVLLRDTCLGNNNATFSEAEQRWQLCYVRPDLSPLTRAWVEDAGGVPVSATRIRVEFAGGQPGTVNVRYGIPGPPLFCDGIPIVHTDTAAGTWSTEFVAGPPFASFAFFLEIDTAPDPVRPFFMRAQWV